MSPLLEDCPLLGGSFIGGFTVSRISLLSAQCATVRTWAVADSTGCRWCFQQACTTGSSLCLHSLNMNKTDTKTFPKCPHASLSGLHRGHNVNFLEKILDVVTLFDCSRSLPQSTQFRGLPINVIAPANEALNLSYNQVLTSTSLHLFLHHPPLLEPQWESRHCSATCWNGTTLSFVAE